MDHLAQQALKKLQQVCSRQEKCTADILEYLIRNDINQAYHQTIIEQLKAEKYLDEERYARAVVMDKFRLNRWGRIKIRYFLRSKRIPGEIIAAALDSIDETEYIISIQQELSKKAKTLKSEDPEVKKMKLLQFAASKGFEEDLIWKLMKSITI